MSNEEIGRLNIDIGLTDGNFTRNIGKIKREIGAVEAEIKSATAGVGKFEKGLETLGAESKGLERKLQLQTMMVKEMKREYDHLLETKKEDSKQVQNSYTVYKRAEAEMKRLQSAVRNVNTQIQDQSSEYTKLSRNADKALSGIQQDLKVLESGYKLTAAGMTRMGSESQHLQAQSQHMQKVFDLESKAVNELRRKLDECKRSKGEDARETKELQVQYNNARAKANETRQTLDRLNNTITDQTGRWGRLRQRMHDASGGFNDVGHDASGMASDISRGFGVASLAIGGGLAYASKKSMDFESQLSSIQALTGASADEMARMRDLAQEMGAKTVFSSLEAAQAIEELLKAGLTPAQVSAGGLQEALNLATAGGLDLAKAAEIMSTALNAYKDDGMSAADASNILAGSANASATSVEELQYGLAQVGAVASGVGLSFKDTNAALGVFANNGLKGSDAGTSLKTMLGNLSPKTKAQYNAFQELGLMAFDTAKGMEFLKENGIKPTSDSMEDVSEAIKKYIQKSMGAKKWNADCEKSFQGLGMSAGFMNNAFYDTNGNIEDMATISEQLKKSLTGLTSEQRQQYLYTLFGSDAIRAGNILYKEGADGINNFKKAMGNVTAEEVATEKLNNLKGEIEQLKGSFETMAITAGKAVEPVVRAGVAGLQKIVDGFNNMPKGLQKFIVYGAMAAGALAGIAAAGLAVVGVIGSIGIGIGGMALAGEVIVGIGAVALPVIGTIGLVVAGILAFGAAAVLLYKHWDKVQGFLNKNPFVKFLAHMNPVSGALLGIVGTVKKVQGVFDKIGLSSGLMSDKISESTKKSIKSYTDLEQKATNSYINMNAKGTALTQKFVDSQAQLHGQMSKKIQDAIDKDYNKRIEKAKALFAKNDGLSKEEEARVLQRMKNDQQNKKDRVKAYEKQIHEIEQKASDERRKLTESEKRTISGIKNNMRVEAVKAMSKSEKEQMIILGRLKNDASKMSAQQAANVVKSSVKQRDETIKNANKQYTKTVHEIEMMRDVTGDITAEDARDMIAKAKKKRDESIKHATEMNEKVVAEAKKQAEGHASEVDWETGEVLSKWDHMTDRVGDLMDWVKGLFGKGDKSKTKDTKPKAKAVHKKGDTYGGKKNNGNGRALGTPYGGTPTDEYALTGEEGAELVKDGRTGGMYLTGVGGAEVRYLSKGSSVLPAHMTQAVLKKYGFGKSMPAYAEGVGIGNFDDIMQGAEGLWNKGMDKFGLSDGLLPKWFTDKSGSAMSYIGGLAKDKIQSWVDEFMESFGGGGDGSYTGIGGYYLSSPFRITTRFTPNGNKKDKVHKGGVHRGLDLAASAGTPIKSLTAGIVKEVLINNKTGGNLARIQSGSDLLSYAHMLKAPSVKVGQHVKEGQVIGYVGSTGKELPLMLAIA